MAWEQINTSSRFSNQLSFHRQLSLPPTIHLVLFLFILRHKGSPGNLHHELFMKRVSKVLPISVVFLAHGAEYHRSRILYGTVKWKQALTTRWRGAKAMEMEMPLFLFYTQSYSCGIHSKTKIGGGKKKQLGLNKSQANFHALNFKRKQELKSRISKLLRDLPLAASGWGTCAL